MLKPDKYGAGDLLHGRGENNYLRGKDRRRGLIAAMRQHLKKCNYHNFDDLLASFKFYDPVSTSLINSFLTYCIFACFNKYHNFFLHRSNHPFFKIFW